MTTIAYLTSSDMVPGRPDARDDIFELELQWSRIQPACAARGLSLELCVWDDPVTARRVASGEFAAVVIGTAWDYHGRAELFLQTIEGFESHVPVFNGSRTLRWNSRKSYLRDLAAAGARVVPTYWAESVEPGAVAEAHADLDADRLVAKPIVGACAERQVRLERGKDLPPADQCPPGEALIQPFIPSIQTEGELSFLYFGGMFSHALVKRPLDGDYRVQSVYGGTEAVYAPTVGELDVAAAVLAAVPGCVPADLLYARVDLVRAEDGGLMLMELELIEPYLYPEQGPRMGEVFVQALLAGLEAEEVAG